MIGEYISNGISVRYLRGRGHGWGARLTFQDAGFCNDIPSQGIVSTEGTLTTRYFVKEGEGADALAVAIDALKADAERLGIGWYEPTIYYEGDGENTEFPPPPNWQDLVSGQARRLGWQEIYRGTGGSESAEPAWLAKIRLPLRLARGGGVLLLVRGQAAHRAQILSAIPGAVETPVDGLPEVPADRLAIVRLAPSEYEAANLGRPRFGGRPVILWCESDEEIAALRQGAPDLFDWHSHAIFADDSEA